LILVRNLIEIAEQNKLDCSAKQFILQKEKPLATTGNGFSVRSEAPSRPLSIFSSSCLG
jgi:hypothetical protein